MAKALTPVVIILLLLSVGSLLLGFQLFGKREVLKGRVQQTEQALGRIASNIGYEGFRVGALAADDPEGLTRMTAPLNQLAAATLVQYTELQDTRQDLETTRQDLNGLRDEHDRALADLDQARSEANNMRTQFEQVRSQVAAKDAEISRLQEKDTRLNMQIQDLNNEIAQTGDELRDAQDKIITLEETVKLMEVELGGATGMVAEGLTGRVLHVNRDWNFVIIDLGTRDGLAPKTEMLIHRADTLVGKVMVSNLGQDMAIAELQPGWTQTTVEEGDYVVF
jgi:uncharacterized phage infection (PIP) family protein YhgE